MRTSFEQMSEGVSLRIPSRSECGCGEDSGRAAVCRHHPRRSFVPRATREGFAHRAAVAANGRSRKSDSAKVVSWFGHATSVASLNVAQENRCRTRKTRLKSRVRLFLDTTPAREVKLGKAAERERRHPIAEYGCLFPLVRRHREQWRRRTAVGLERRQQPGFCSGDDLVDDGGFEPPTPALRTRCSPN